MGYQTHILRKVWSCSKIYCTKYTLCSANSAQKGREKVWKKKIKSAQKCTKGVREKQTNSGQMEAEKETKSALKEKRDQ